MSAAEYQCKKRYQKGCADETPDRHLCPGVLNGIRYVYPNYKGNDQP